jgi:hypothetical protein
VDVQSLMFLVMVLLMWAVVLPSVKRARDLLLVVSFWAIVAALCRGLA